VPAVWARHGAFVYVYLRRQAVKEDEDKGVFTDFEKYMMQLLQKVIVEHLRSL
jgi:hypothetical protein